MRMEDGRVRWCRRQDVTAVRGDTTSTQTRPRGRPAFGTSFVRVCGHRGGPARGPSPLAAVRAEGLSSEPPTPAHAFLTASPDDGACAADVRPRERREALSCCLSVRVLTAGVPGKTDEHEGDRPTTVSGPLRHA